MHTDTKPAGVGSADRTEGSCRCAGKPAPAGSVKPSAVPGRFPAEQRPETKREAVPGKSKGCCCSG